MSDKFNNISEAIDKLEKVSNGNHKGRRRAILDIFEPLLEADGYKMDQWHMKRHSYVDYIASSGKRNNKKSIGVLYRSEKTKVTKDEIEDLVAGCAIDGIEKVLVITGADFEEDVDKYCREKYPVVYEQLNSASLRDWAKNVDPKGDEAEFIKIVGTFTQKIIGLMLKRPNVLSSLEWRDLERVIAELFTGIGYDTTLTPPSKDGGKDVIVEFREREKKKSYIVEIKHWRSGQKVGQKSITEFVKVIVKEKRHGGLFLSTFGFADNAMESITEIERKKIRFANDEKVHTLCKVYMRKKSGLLLEDESLSKILFDNTN